MKIAKMSNFIASDKKDITESYITDLDVDINNIFLMSKGRIRFGDGTTATNGENMSGQWVEFTSHATPDTEFSVAHTVGVIPVGRIIVWQDKSGNLYQSPTTGTDWTATNVYFKCNVASVTFKIFLLK